MTKYNLHQILERFKIVHGNKYDYSKFVFVNITTKGIIICKDHGEFFQSAHKHISGRGCPTCASQTRGIKQRNTFSDFVKAANKVHGGIYEYPQETDVYGDNKIPIICRIHGIFYKSYYKHVNSKQGCPKCTNDLLSIRFKKTTKQFILESNKVHNNLYSYNNTHYKDAHSKVIITCKLHGNFEQSPNMHLGGNGCPVCAISKQRSKVADTWLRSLNIQDMVYEYKLPENNRLRVDGFSPSTNTVYQFHGDYWHGNPSKYDGNLRNAHNGMLFKDLYAKTILAESKIKSYGYNLIVMWESDFIL